MNKLVMPVLVLSALVSACGGSDNNESSAVLPAELHLSGLSGDLLIKVAGSEFNLSQDGVHALEGISSAIAPSFQVTLEPTHQSCVLNGTIEESSQTWTLDVQCQDKAWAALDVDDGITLSEGSYDLLQVAMNDSGFGIRSWVEKVNDETKLLAQTYESGQWSQAQIISDTNRCVANSEEQIDSSQTTHINRLHLSVNNQNQALLLCGEYYSAAAQQQVFLRGSQNSEKLYVLNYIEGQWAAPGSSDEAINKNLNSDYTLYAQGALADNGDQLVVWRQSNALFKSEKREGDWLIPASNNDAVNSQGMVVTLDMDMANNGHAIIAYNIQSGFTRPPVDVYVTEFNGDNWLPGKRLSPSIENVKVEAAADIVLDMDDQGGATLAWTGVLTNASTTNDHRQYLFMAERNNEGAWVSPGTLDHSIQVGQVIYINSVALARNNQGQAVLSWRQQHGYDESVEGFHNALFISEKLNGEWSHADESFAAVNTDNTLLPVMTKLSEAGDALIQSVKTVEINGDEHSQLYVTQKRFGQWLAPVRVSPELGSHDNEPASMVWTDKGTGLIEWIAYPDGSSQKALFKVVYQ